MTIELTPSLRFTLLIIGTLVLQFSMQMGLLLRQARHVARHRHAVPEAFAGEVSLPAHQRAAAYTLARCQSAMLQTALNAAFFLGWTLLGGLAGLADALQPSLAPWPWVQPVVWVGVVGGAAGLMQTALSYVQHFGIEARFGFNRMTRRQFLVDTFKAGLLGLTLGGALVIVLVAILFNAGKAAWLWAWLAWAAGTVSLVWAFPNLIAPWFNQFKPLPPGPLRSRIEALLTRCGFQSGGVFVIDSSRRSSHGNAYFSGLGRTQRIVLYDTLLQQLDDAQIEAVLAHELGHFKHHHVLKRLALSLLLSLGVFAACATLAEQAWFYQGLGVTPLPGEPLAGYALVLCGLTLPWATWFLQPLGNALFRHHEFQADAFAAQHTRAADLAQALLRLYRDNAATLTPDPLYSVFYHAHPTASARLARLQAPAALPCPNAR